MAEQTPFQLRFDAAMKHVKAPTRAAFGAMLGVSGEGAAQRLYNWIKRDQRIPDDQRRGLAAIGLSIDWINDGDGSMAAGTVSGPATGTDYVRAVDMGMEGDMGDGRINDDHPEVIKAVDYAQQYIRGLIGFVPPPGRLVLVTGRGDSMTPTIQPGESLLVDTGVLSYDGDGVYLVNLGNGQQIKRLVDHGEDDGVYVHSDNKAYPALPFPRGGVVAGKVYLRNRVDRFN